MDLIKCDACGQAINATREACPFCHASITDVSAPAHDLYHGKTMEIRFSAARRLGDIGSNAAVQVLAKALTDEHRYCGDLSLVVAEHLARIGEPAVPALTSLLDDGGARPYALEALRVLHPGEAVPSAPPNLPQSRILGGHGLPPRAGETWDVVCDCDALVLTRDFSQEVRIPYAEMVALEIGGPGERTSGGGFFGGGFGLAGAAAGMLVATALNLLTSHTEVDTVLCVQTGDSELFIHTSAYTPDDLRMRLSSVFVRMRQEQARLGQTRIADAPPADDIVERLAKLASLHESGMLTDEEFATFKARLLG